MNNRAKNQVFAGFRRQRLFTGRPQMPEQTEQEKKIQEIKTKLNDLSYGILRAQESIELIKKSNFPGSEALKVAWSLEWLEYLLKNLKSQHDGLEAQLKALTPVEPKVVEAEKPAEGAAQ